MSHNRTENEGKTIAAAIRGEAWAQKTIYDQHAPTMMSICYRYVNDIETAKDLLQDGFVRVFNKLNTYAGTGSFEGWLRRVFVTTCLEFLRQKNALKMSSSLDEVIHPVVDSASDVISNISADELMTMIGSLAEGYRTVFNLYVIEGYAHAEIAAMLGISEVTSRSQFMRARKLLQEMITDAYGKQ